MAWDPSAFNWTNTINQAAEQRRLAEVQPQLVENNLLRNRLMGMEIEEKGQSLAAQKAKENYLMSYDPNNPASLRKPTNVGEYQGYQEIQGRQQAEAQAIVNQGMTAFEAATKMNKPELWQATRKQILDSGVLNPESPKYNRYLEPIRPYLNIEATSNANTKYERPYTFADEKAVNDFKREHPETARLDISPNIEYRGTFDYNGKLAELKAATAPKEPVNLDTRKVDLRTKLAAGTISAKEKAELDVINQVQGEEDARKLKVAKAQRAIIVNNPVGGNAGAGVSGGASFSSFSPEMKKVAFEDYMNTGRMPDFGSKWRNAGADYKQFTKEYYTWRTDGKITAGDVAGHRADVSAMKDLTKREQLIGTFTNRIDATSKVVINLAQKWGNKDNRLLNIPINKLASSVGSGDYQSLRLALKSLSNEVAKVESGSLGIAEVSQSQAEAMAKIHDADLSLNDLVKIINTGKALGKTNMDSIGEQRKKLKERIDTTTDNERKPKSQRDTSKAHSYLTGANSKADAIGRIRALAAQGWSKDELNEIVKGTKWE